MPVEGQYLNVNVDMRPDFDLIVNVQATLDPISREIYWVHRALDPRTLDLPYDPHEGYLPPVDPDWYNVGWVKYRIKPNPGLPDGTVFTNQAHVNFDGVGPWGPAPPYGPYVNTYDLTNPVSTVNALAYDTAAAKLAVGWTGDDGQGSGIEGYTIYVSEDSVNYAVWLDTTATLDTFVGEYGKTYCFFTALPATGFSTWKPYRLPRYLLYLGSLRRGVCRR
ncbi:MAG: hypothetical protein IPM98_06335 [Lewinellaceae bacterium]|nr:hypothetical protein [Lewinellaceae bacterium]